VIFVMVLGDISSSVRAMKQGAVDVLIKPVERNELLEAVQLALAWGAAERQTRQQKRDWRVRYAAGYGQRAPNYESSAPRIQPIGQSAIC